MKQFDQICREPFEVYSCEPRSPDSSEPQPSTTGESSTPAEPEPKTVLSQNTDSEPQPSTSGESSTPAEPEPKTVSLQNTDSKKLSLRSEAWTPRKKNLKRRLDFVSKSASDMKKRHADNIKDLRAKLRVSKVKELNQVIKRKQTTTDNLRTQIHNNEVAKDLTETKKKLFNLGQKYQRLKKQRRKPNAAGSCTRCQIVYDEFDRLSDHFKVKDDTIRTLENEKLLLEERLAAFEELGTGSYSSLVKEGKTYTHDMRMLVYDSLVNHVPTGNIPLLIEKFVKRSGLQLEHLPHRHTVEMMARELGVISDFQVAERLMQGDDLTLGFDATTQEGCTSMKSMSPASKIAM